MWGDKGAQSFWSVLLCVRCSEMLEVSKGEAEKEKTSCVFPLKASSIADPLPWRKELKTQAHSHSRIPGPAVTGTLLARVTHHNLITFSSVDITRCHTPENAGQAQLLLRTGGKRRNKKLFISHRQLTVLQRQTAPRPTSSPSL